MEARLVPRFAAALLWLGILSCQADAGMSEGADPETDSPLGEVELSEDAKFDGGFFSGQLYPLATSLSAGTLEGSFYIASYEAYYFEVREPSRLLVQLQFKDTWRDFAVLLGARPVDRYTSTILLFRLDENAVAVGATDAESLWDLYASGPADEGTLDHEVTSGVYMVVAFGNDQAYYRRAEYLLDIRSEDTLLSDQPGNVTLSVVTHDGQTSFPVVGIRVALGNVAAVTDENGQAVLEGVPAGDHILKLGPDGSGRAIHPHEVRVFGDDIDQTTTVLVAWGDYSAWQ